MFKRLVRELAIEEALQEEIKHTPEHNNQSYVDWCALSDKDKNNNKVKLTLKYNMLLVLVMKSFPLNESYLLTDDLFCQPMLYFKVSLTLLLFLSLSNRAQQSPYD